ncbi:MAG: hypothetical protein AABZ31_05730 [Bdellovibrionota bacterium]
MEEFDHDKEHPLEVEILSRDGSIREGYLVLSERTPQERVVRAVQAFFLWMLAALISLFIPMLHFILVPAFILVALFMGANGLFDVFKVESGEITCARCGTVNHIEAQNETYPIHIDCDHCDARMTAYRAAAGELTG